MGIPIPGRDEESQNRSANPQRQGGIPRNIGNGQQPQRPAQPPRQRSGGLPSLDDMGETQPRRTAPPQQRPAQQQQRSPQRTQNSQPGQQAPVQRQTAQQPQRPVQQNPAQRENPQQQRRPIQQAPVRQKPPVQQSPQRAPASSPGYSAVDDAFNVDDEVFQQVSFDEIDNDEELDFGGNDLLDGVEEIEETPAPPRRRQAAKAPAKTARSSGDLASALIPEEEPEYEDTFIDKKKGKLKPFGSGKKSSVNVGDFDKRKNLAKNNKIYRGIFVTAVIAIVGFGAYKTFMPQQNFTMNEIGIIAQQAMGETGFPLQKGEGFAQSFIGAYLKVTPDYTNTVALSYFYGNGESVAESFSDKRAVSGTAIQDVLYGPVVFDSTAISETSASYTVGALVQTRDSAAKGEVTQETVAASVRWMVFNVNVYHDTKTDTFAVTPDSPSLVPAETVKNPADVPVAEKLGEALTDEPNGVNSTIVGYLKGYRVSSPSNHAEVDQYIKSSSDPNLIKGLGGKFAFATPDDPEQSIEYKLYSPDGGDSTLKADIKVDWTIKLGNEQNSPYVQYSSKYVITLAKQPGGSYLVEKMAPFYYVEGSENSE